MGSGVQGDGPGQEIDGGFALADLEGEHSQQMQGIDVPGVPFQDLPIEVFRLGQTAPLVMLHGGCNASERVAMTPFRCKQGDSRGPWMVSHVRSPSTSPTGQPVGRVRSTAISRR